MYAVSRSLLKASALRQSAMLAQATAPARQYALQIVPAPTEIKKEDVHERNERLGRVLSPHLSIYKPQLTTILSITHRGTGLALSGYATILGLGALMSSHDFAHYVTMLEGLHMGAGTLLALKFVLGYPFAYHFANGIRHLTWDTGKFLNIKEVYSTGYAMILASFILGGILAVL